MDIDKLGKDRTRLITEKETALARVTESVCVAQETSIRYTRRLTFPVDQCSRAETERAESPDHRHFQLRRSYIETTRRASFLVRSIERSRETMADRSVHLHHEDLQAQGRSRSIRHPLPTAERQSTLARRSNHTRTKTERSR